MSMRSTIALAMLAACAAACTEQAQTATPAKKADAKPWEGAQGGNVAAGWKAGDKDAWETQMRLRVQGQNEYSRGAPELAAAETAPAAAKTP
ncbi:MAG TPA: hypothetical protein VIV84_05270 [Burkholderiaceae bacterium]|jgi:hypothetical protein